jgi:uncharacterized membrane protein YwzB
MPVNNHQGDSDVMHKMNKEYPIAIILGIITIIIMWWVLMLISTPKKIDKKPPLTIILQIYYTRIYGYKISATQQAEATVNGLLA